MNIQLNDIQDDIRHSVDMALKEDIGSGDITAMLIPEDKHDQATIITREQCVMCGQAWLEETYRQLGGLDHIQWHVNDGDLVPANTALVTLKGRSRTLLTGERTALNFVQLLSATASKAHLYAQTLGEAKLKVLDTRKTIPGLRTAQKYAVAIGGCHNHRIGLYDAFLIKENHILACGGIAQAVSAAKKLAPHVKVEVETENLQELQQAIDAGADVAMLDNFSDAQIAEACTLARKNTQYEISGNLTRQDLAKLKQVNIDFISFGDLTKHIQAIDLSFRVTSTC